MKKQPVVSRIIFFPVHSNRCTIRAQITRLSPPQCLVQLLANSHLLRRGEDQVA